MVLCFFFYFFSFRGLFIVRLFYICFGGYLRFKNMWLVEPGFSEWVKVKWSSYVVEGKPCFRLLRKLKMLMEDLKRWNRESFGRIEVRITNILEEIRRLDEK